MNSAMGYIHNLITLGTPHLGTNLALLTLNGNNGCVPESSALFGEYSLWSVNSGGQTYPGAAADQRGDPTSPFISPPNQTLELLNAGQRTSTIPTAFIAATFGTNNDS